MWPVANTVLCFTTPGRQDRHDCSVSVPVPRGDDGAPEAEGRERLGAGRDPAHHTGEGNGTV